MMKKIWVIGALAGIAAAVFACSSSSSGGGGSNSCVFAGSSSACQSCVQSNCSSQLNQVESACSDYFSCMCPGGSFNACNAQTCAPKITSACQQAEQSATCTACTSQCTTSSGSSSGGTVCNSSSSSGGSSSSSGGSGSSSGGGMYTCSQLSGCCPMLPMADQSGCTSIVNANNQAECSAAYSTYKSASLCQ